MFHERNLPQKYGSCAIVFMRLAVSHGVPREYLFPHRFNFHFFLFGFGIGLLLRSLSPVASEFLIRVQFLCQLIQIMSRLY